jgi:adenylate cyclase class 2
MSHEIEAKIRVVTLAPFCEKLNAMDAVFLHEARQIDTYFMDTHKLLHKKDCGLRIRNEQVGDAETAHITFKGARTDSQYKSRPEFETCVSDPVMMEKIFEALGYHKRVTLEKKRRIWTVDSCHVCLDEVPRLGSFIEVEGPDEQVIASVLEKLGLGDEPHIRHGYATMMERELKLEKNEEPEARQE